MGEESVNEAGGRCFEDFKAGMVLAHPLGRTVSSADNAWSTLLAVNTNPIHFDAHYASQTEFGNPLVNSPFILALVTGLSVADISRYGVNLGWDEVRLPAPVFEGDTIYARSEILSARESKSRPHMGIIEVRTEGFNQNGTIVITFRRSVMVYRRAHVPTVPLPRPR